MYAIFETGGKQYQAEPGSVLQVESLDGEVGATIDLPMVQFIQIEPEPLLGQPTIPNAVVKAEILRHGRTRSIMVFKKKRRKKYRRTKGHRQDFTQIRIAEIITPT